MPSCVVRSCKNYTSKLRKSQGITYHSFPRNEHRKDDWIQIIRLSRGEQNWKPSPSSSVCSAHFDDCDLKTTTKGLRCLLPDAIPKRLLSNSPEIQMQIMSWPILQISPRVKEEVQDQPSSSSPNVKRVKLEAVDEQPSSSSSAAATSLLQVPALTENALTAYCRLCAASECSSKLINFQSDVDLKNLVVKMSNRLNANIDFGKESLPTTICYVCVKTLYTTYDFVVGIDQAQTTLNNIFMTKQVYQMSENGNVDNKDSSTSLQQVSSNIKVEASDFEQPWSHEPSTTAPPPQVNIGAPTNNIVQRPLRVLEFSPSLLESHKINRLNDDLNKKRRLIESQRKKLKTLYQKVRRLKKRNKKLKGRNYIDTDQFDRLNEDIIAVDLFNSFNQKKRKKIIRYTQALKKFCITLYHYSARAYNYVRQSFNTCLPHPTTVAKWYVPATGPAAAPAEEEESETGEVTDPKDSDSDDTKGEPELTDAEESDSDDTKGEPELTEPEESETVDIKGEPGRTEESLRAIKIKSEVS